MPLRTKEVLSYILNHGCKCKMHYNEIKFNIWLLLSSFYVYFTGFLLFNQWCLFVTHKAKWMLDIFSI